MYKKTNFHFQNNKNFSILIIRLSSIGDIVLTTHLIRNLRNSFPNSKIDFLTFKNFREILEYNPRINNLYYVEKQDLKNGNYRVLSNSKVLFELNEYSCIIDLQNNQYSRKLLLGIESKVFSLDKHRLHKLCLVFFKKPLVNNFSVPINYFSTTNSPDIIDDGLGLEFWLQGEYIYTPFQKNNNNFPINHIVLSPGAAHGTKQYPKEKYVELINLLFKKYNCQFSIVGGIKEIEISKFIQDNIYENIIIHNFCGKIILQETAAIIDKSNIFIGNDTGLMHIAAARQIPVIAIFGSSVKDFGFEPFRVKHKIIEKDLWCRPCSHIGRKSCPLGHFNCMNKITAEDIVQAVEELNVL